MKTNEELIERKIPYQETNDKLVSFPTEITLSTEGMPIPTDAKKAVRNLKKNDWDAGLNYELTNLDGIDNQSVFVMFYPHENADEAFFMGERKSPHIIAKFTPGKPAKWSSYVADDAPTYPFTDKVIDNISIKWSNPEDNPVVAESILINFDGGFLTLSRKGDFYQIDEGFAKTDDIEELDYGGKILQVKDAYEFGYFPQGKGIGGCGLDILDEEYYEKFEKQFEDGGGTAYLTKKCSVYASPDLYIGTAKEDDYLLPPDVDYDNISSLASDEAVIFNLLIPNQTFTTDNYTGRNTLTPSAPLVETLILPGDEGLLAPIGIDKSGNTVNCGENSPEGRTIKSVTPFIENGEVISVKMEFRDGSSCLFPDPETKEFSATDKETGQLLKGTVQTEGFYKYSGNPTQEYEKIKQARRERNLNRKFNIIVDDDNITRSLAWYAGEAGEILKILVPDPDNESESIIISIPMQEI